MRELFPDEIAGVTIHPLVWDIVLPIGSFLCFGLLAYIVYFILHRVARDLTRRRGTDLGERLIQATYRPITYFILVQGLLAAALVVTDLDRLESAVDTDPALSVVLRIWAVLSILLVASGTARVTAALLNWYGQNYAANEGAPIGSNLVGPLRRFVTLAIYGVAILIMLELMGISVTPLVAGLGIGGLAVALAVQPTLSNFFAGSYLAGDRVVRRGDFVRLENGLEGYVQDVGWRSTRLLTPYNNLVVIPNSRLADNMLTNYSYPESAIGVLLMCGVSYSSDLAEVERLAREAAQKALDETEGADHSMAPWFGFETFGDSNVDFWVWVQAKDRVASFLLKSELIKALHQRFGAEGITINYPMRHLVFPEGGPTVTQGHPGAQDAGAPRGGEAPPQ